MNDSEIDLQLDIKSAIEDANRLVESIEKEINKLKGKASMLSIMSARLVKAMWDDENPANKLNVGSALNIRSAIAITLAETDNVAGVSPGHNIAALRRLQVALVDSEACHE